VRHRYPRTKATHCETTWASCVWCTARTGIAKVRLTVLPVTTHRRAEHNFNVIGSPKISIQIDDARHVIIGPWLADAAINRDRNLRLQYLAGLGLNLYQSDLIYSDMLNYRKYPDGLFTGTPETLQNLRQAIQRMQGR
jgi:hypothetical protein